ncbi:MAG: hypothetical protein E7515_05705 [Ruminococcaceae bacterium]|nr:hypothetical protein [Oscillospiraceae bacterium]
MAKKEKPELTPEQLEAKKIKKQRRSEGWTKFWAVVLALVLVCGVAFGAKTLAGKAVAKAKEEAASQQADIENSGTPAVTPGANTNTNTTPTPAAPADNNNNAAPADNSGSNDAAPADNNGGDAAPASNDPATVAGIINNAMAAAANAGYTWSRTGNITELNVPSKDTLNKIISGVSEGSTVDSVVGGFLGAKGNTETLTISAGQTPMNEEGTDKYYHWDHYKIIPTSVTAEDLQNLQVNGNEYTFTLAACQNPSPGSAGFSRFSNDYVTLDEVNTEIKANVSVVSVSDMTATFGPMNVKMTIENGKVTALHYDYTASVNPMNLKATIIPISANGAMQVSADYTNFKY